MPDSQKTTTTFFCAIPCRGGSVAGGALGDLGGLGFGSERGSRSSVVSGASGMDDSMRRSSGGVDRDSLTGSARKGAAFSSSGRSGSLAGDAEVGSPPLAPLHRHCPFSSTSPVNPTPPPVCLPLLHFATYLQGGPGQYADAATAAALARRSKMRSSLGISPALGNVGEDLTEDYGLDAVGDLGGSLGMDLTSLGGDPMGGGGDYFNGMGGPDGEGYTGPEVSFFFFFTHPHSHSSFSLVFPHSRTPMPPCCLYTGGGKCRSEWRG